MEKLHEKIRSFLEVSNLIKPNKLKVKKLKSMKLYEA